MLKIDSLLKTCFNDVTYHFLGGSLRLAFQHSPTLLSICLHMCTLMSILHLLSCSIWKHGKSLWIWRFYAGFGMVFPGFFPHLARRAPRPKWTRQSSSINSGGWDHWAGFFWQDAIGNSHTMYGILAFFLPRFSWLLWWNFFRTYTVYTIHACFKILIVKSWLSCNK